MRIEYDIIYTPNGVMIVQTIDVDNLAFESVTAAAAPLAIPTAVAAAVPVRRTSFHGRCDFPDDAPANS